MNGFLVELVGPREVAERRRTAERERMLAVVEASNARHRPLAVALGRMLVRSGQRVEALGTSSAARRPVGQVGDPCGGCAN